MRKGAKSFSQFSALVVPVVLVFSYIMGSPTILLAFVGLFVVLQLANRADR